MSRQAPSGLCSPPRLEAQAELAERIVDRVASVEKIRFTDPVPRP